ncbi:MAG: cysteine desulfurase family protein [Lachnospiraceae bacterium]|nr:cysteine desulfurase family protein [Lachnospiraceae bacterium]
MKEIYFDNSSTTKPYPAVVDMVVRTMTEDYGNPSSMHQKGVEAEKYVKDAAKILAGLMKVREKEIFFTSGGTESNNWALVGAALANQRAGKTIITSPMEHPAVSEPLKYLKDQGFNIVEIPLDKTGALAMDKLEAALNEDVILVSIMYVNNEVGTVTPVKEIGTLIKAKAPGALFHVDATQAFGHYRIYPKELKVDLLTASAHKFHGPKGVGFLYIEEHVKIRPLIMGGGQQMAMRSGTDNVPGVAGMGVAAEESYRDFEAKNEHLRSLRRYLIDRLSEMDNVVVHGGAEEQQAPHIVNAAFIGVGSEVLLHSLEDNGIYISAGSACSTHKRAPSPTLSALHVDRDDLSSSVRFSFSETNTKEEIDEAVAVLNKLLPMLRRYRAH